MPITETELAEARRVWGEALVAIAKAYEADGIRGARPVAEGALDTIYGYNLGPVLFKPTMASGEKTFRPTRIGALAYFIGHDVDFPHDSGFGLKNWRTVESETAASFIEGDVATSPSMKLAAVSDSTVRQFLRPNPLSWGKSTSWPIK